MQPNEPSDWFLDASRIRLKLPSGQIIAPTAMEIASAEFKDRLNIRGESVKRRPSDALLQLKFTRFPPSLAIRLVPPSSDLARPAFCAVCVEADGKSAPADLSELDEQDQVIVGVNWYPLAVNEVSEIRQLLNEVGVESVGELSLKQYLALLKVDATQVKVTTSDVIVGAVVRERVALSLPPTFRATLYHYQEDGFRWLSRIADEELGCILGDEMGLGKTIQIIALIARETFAGRKPCLVVAPATLLENWRREIARFAVDLSVCVHSGSERTGFPSALQDFDIVLTSYDTAVRDSSILEMVPWNILILDEAQAIKTPDAQRTISIKELPRRIAIAVSGTPVENKLRDLWSLLDFAVPGLLGSLEEFERRYSDTEDAASLLEPLVSPLILRRMVVDVAPDLPERIEIPQPIELAVTAARAYDALREDIAREYGAAANLVSITRLRMFCAHPWLLEGKRGDPRAESTKYERLLEIIDEIVATQEKAIIFTSFTDMADLLVADLASRYKMPCLMIDGRTSVSRRQPVVDEFSSVSGSAALILNPRAAGTGLNITAATHVIHYNLEWNPAVEDQATARAHRRGQERPVTVHRLFHVGTVEEVIDQRMARKRAIAELAVVGTAGKKDDLADIMRALSLSPITRNDGPAHV